MAISVQCGDCGRKISARPELAGKKVKCPQCGSAISIPERGPSAPAAASPQRITVRCEGCDKQFQAGANLAGKRVKCPQCGQPVSVPAPGARSGGPNPSREPNRSAGPRQASPPSSGPSGRTPAPPANPLGSLLDEEFAAGALPTVPTVGQTQCPGCGAAMPAGAVLCVQCGYDVRVGRSVTSDAPKPTRKPGTLTGAAVSIAIVSIIWGLLQALVNLASFGVAAFNLYGWISGGLNEDDPRSVFLVVILFSSVLMVAGALMTATGIGVLCKHKGSAGSMSTASGVFLGMSVFVLITFFIQLWRNEQLNDQTFQDPRFIGFMIGAGVGFAITGSIWIWANTQGKRLDAELPEPEITLKKKPVRPTGPPKKDAEQPAKH